MDESAKPKARAVNAGKRKVRRRKVKVDGRSVVIQREPLIEVAVKKADGSLWAVVDLPKD